MDHLEILESELRLRGFSNETTKSYLSHNKKFLNYINKKPRDITEADIKIYLNHLIMHKSNSNSTIALVKSALTFYYATILGKKINIKTPKIPKKVPTILTKDEIKKLISSTKNLKHRLLIELLYSSGLRLSEIVNLKLNDLEMEEGIGWVRSGKGSKDRMFILSEKVIKDLKTYLKKHQGDYLFKGRTEKYSPRAIQKLVKEAATRANIKKNVHPHVLRHSFATHLLEDGVDIRYIQALLGHSNLSTTQIYTAVSTSKLKKIKSPLDSM